MKAWCILLTLLVVTPSVSVAADPIPDPDTLIKRMIEAAGGDDFQGLGVIELQAHEEETTTDGKTTKQRYRAYLNTARQSIGDLRVEIDNGVVLGCNNNLCWATQNGKLDERPQTPRMAGGAIRQRLFPLLLPFSLRMDGVQPDRRVSAGYFEGEEVYQLALDFKPMFFAAPIMTTTWHLVVRQSDFELISAEFLPPRDYRSVQPEGVRYRYLQREELEGIRLPSRVLLDGIDLDRTPTGHVRVVNLEATVRGPFEPALFINPQELEKLEEQLEGFEEEE
jgi:hypothetical protein